MGLRGPGASRVRAAREEDAAATKKRRLPWEKKGLNRVEKIVAFLEFLPITKGKLQGKRIEFRQGLVTH